MKIILHGGRYDGDVMEFAELPSDLAVIMRPDPPYNPGSTEVAPFAEVPEIAYRRSNRIIAGNHVFVLAESKL